MITIILTALCLSCSFFSCNKSVPNDLKMSRKLVGCWRGGIVQNDCLVERDMELRLISFRADSSIELSAIYELGPRSRVWEYSIPIACWDNTARWLAHEGHLSQDGDTMYVEKNWKGDKSDWMFIRDTSSCHMLTQLMLSKNQKYSYSTPDASADNWNCAALTEAKFDDQKITNLISQTKKGKFGDIHSLLICRNGKLVLEEYFALNGELTGSFVNHQFRNKVHYLASTTKGILSLLAGIAIDKGFINNVNDPISKYMPEFKSSFNDKIKEINIQDLITMQSGWKWEQFLYSWNDKRNNAAEMYRCKDVIKYVLERPMAYDAGTHFNYSNGDPTVLGYVLESACEMKLVSFAEQFFFKPLDISDYIWTSYPDGTLETDGGLALCSRDLAKIGQLVLQNGKWKEQQLTSPNWIKESTIGRISLSRVRSYGYYWNQMELEISGREEKAIFVPGDGGQFLAVFPSLNMVIVITAGNYNQDATTKCWALIKKAILPAVVDISLNG